MFLHLIVEGYHLDHPSAGNKSREHRSQPDNCQSAIPKENVYMTEHFLKLREKKLNLKSNVLSRRQIRRHISRWKALCIHI